MLYRDFMILPTFFASTHPEFRDTIFSRPPNKRGVAVNRQKIYGVTIDTGFSGGIISHTTTITTGGGNIRHHHNAIATEPGFRVQILIVKCQNCSQN